MNIVIYILYNTCLGFDKDFLYVQYVMADDVVIITNIVYALCLSLDKLAICMYQYFMIIRLTT